MKKFLKNVLGFLFLLGIINCLIYVFAQKIYFRDYQVIPNKQFHSYIFSDSHGLPIGNKAERYGIYNFSSEGDSYNDIKIKINFLLENKYAVDTIYLSADDHMLSPYRSRRNNNDRSEFYLTLHDYENIFSYIKGRFIKRYLIYFQPKVRSIFKNFCVQKLITLFSSQSKNSTENIPWSEATLKEKEALSLTRWKTQYPSKEKDIKLQDALQSILSLCQENKIKVIGLIFPISDTYLQVIKNYSYGTLDVFKKNNVNYLDYKTYYLHQDVLFANQDHLNELGGEKFTQDVFGKASKTN